MTRFITHHRCPSCDTVEPVPTGATLMPIEAYQPGYVEHNEQGHAIVQRYCDAHDRLTSRNGSTNR